MPEKPEHTWTKGVAGWKGFCCAVKGFGGSSGGTCEREGGLPILNSVCNVNQMLPFLSGSAISRGLPLACYFKSLLLINSACHKRLHNS